ncbi:MAG TPA: AarF/ABC1/UbiB kinase family protein [Thermoleophilaceae bacterium]|nr:AarF/ABC1/UbiB kinase family protein [Thermoleophilaceae bacterium]
MAKELPTGRVRRAAKVGRLAGEQTARSYATKAANLGRSSDGRRAAAERRQVEAAEQIFEVLGQMKGAAMKVGQVASFIDTGAFPPEFQERVQAKLAELRDAAPRVPFERMRKVVEDDLDEPLDDSFAEFDPEAVAAASIGQVYRARLHDGTDVAVKVQYPGVSQAVRADLQNLGLIMRVAKRIAPGMDAKAMTREIRERLTDELDYEHEAQNHRAFSRTWRGHPFIYVPPVVTRLCTEHVLVTEWVDGKGFEEVRELDRGERDRFGEIVFRFFFGSLYRTGHFSGDPHPGNYRLMPDGRVAFIDFGMTKRVSAEDVAAEVEAVRLGMERDAPGLHRRLGSMGFFDPADEEITADAVLDHFRDVTRWYIDDGERTIDRKLVAGVLIDFGDPRSRHWELMKRETMPPQAMLARRMEALTLGVLGQLGATANWHRIAREWLFGDPPSTPLGEQEHGFHVRAAA